VGDELTSAPAEAEPHRPLTASDPQEPQDSGMVMEQSGPAGGMDYEEGRSPVPSAEPDRYAGNGLAEAPTETAARTASLDAEELASVRSRWREIQAHFVDEPRTAVQDGDALVVDLMQRVVRMFASERDQLEARWASRSDVSTEDLRQSLQGYRSFFERLLAVGTSAEPPPSTVT
jgi:hypothetical protein